MNVEDLPNDGVKIVFMNPSGNETVRIPRDSQKKNIGEERCYQTMESSDECALMHEEIKPELYKGTSKLVSLEFDEYLKSNSVV